MAALERWLRKMAKIKVRNPVVEMDGDEMTWIIRQFIEDKLIHPYGPAGFRAAPSSTTMPNWRSSP